MLIQRRECNHDLKEHVQNEAWKEKGPGNPGARIGCLPLTTKKCLGRIEWRGMHAPIYRANAQALWVVRRGTPYTQKI